METDYLNFHDGEQFPEFSSNFHQYDFSDDAQKLRMVIDDDFDYIQSQRPHEHFWEIEQELNGDMAVLPASGVSSQMPKIENMNQDFVNTFNDWSEHLGTLQEYESNNELITLQNNLPESLNISFSEIFNDDNNDIYIPIEDTPEDVKIIQSPIKTLPELSSLYLTSPVKESSVSKKVKSEPEEKHIIEVKENFDDWADKEEGCIDVETVSEYQPVLEARDVKSLLEQFEASEANLDLINPNSTKKNTESRQALCEIKKVINKPKDISKSLKSTEPQVSERHKNIRDSLPKEVIDRINASARKKVISVIPALSTNTKNNSRNNNRTTKATSSTRKSSKAVSQNISAFDIVVQNDHTYCTSSSNNNNNSNYASNYNSTGHASKSGKGKQGGKKSINSKVNKPVQNHRNNLIKRMDSWTDSSSKKDSGLESGDVSDASEELAIKSSVNSNDQQNQLINKRSSANNSVPVNKIMNVNSKKNQAKPVSRMKIQSALATSISQMRNGVLTKTKSVDNNILKGKMVSVLKKPPVNKLIGFNESIITTKNSLNDDVQNIIVQDTSLISSLSSSSSSSTSSFVNENKKKPPKRKLNLAEYRSRRDQNSAGNSRTCSPIQPMTLIYIHHASTTTDPVITDSDNPVWSEREIVSMLKPKNMVDEPRIKPAMCDASVQTYETVFDNPNSSDVIVEKPEVEASLTLTDVKVVNNGKISSVDLLLRAVDHAQEVVVEVVTVFKVEVKKRGRLSVVKGSIEVEVIINIRPTNVVPVVVEVEAAVEVGACQADEILDAEKLAIVAVALVLIVVGLHGQDLDQLIGRDHFQDHPDQDHPDQDHQGIVSINRKGIKGRANEKDHGHEERIIDADVTRRNVVAIIITTEGKTSPSYTRNSYNNTWHNHEKTRQVEERRVIYVGRIDEGITKADLRKRFEAFGPVTDISLHFREHG
ncbi:hypothetical protein G9C98_006975 [Cotesia typhae]|uniref:RRM domain-containing protein n=1 Tax=Cotesia typhae TaxID=2053667 RepID=A0A8J5RAE7_9HYME|nr:hypothetical protein G9C98_006975 [Cotesia typhae]